MNAAIEGQRRDAAVELLNALVEARMHAGVIVEAKQLPQRLEIARKEWRRAILRYAGRLDDADLTSRIDEVFIVLSLTSQGGLRPDERDPKRKEWTSRRWRTLSRGRSSTCSSHSTHS